MADLTKHDPSMELAWRAAEQLGAPPPLPAFLQANTLRKANARRAVFLMEVENAIEKQIKPIREGEIAPRVHSGDVKTEDEYKALILSHAPVLPAGFAQDLVIAETTARLLPDMPDPVMRVNVALRLFAGYLDTVKIIADEVRGRKNDATTRQKEMPSVDARARTDPIYSAGVQAAPFYKRVVLQEDIFKDGVSTGSVVLDDWVD